MPAKKKQQKNAFYWYMQELMPQLKREGRVFPNGMADVVGIAHPRWKALPRDEVQRFERIAKDQKKRERGVRADDERLDNVGNVIADHSMVPSEVGEQGEHNNGGSCVANTSMVSLECVGHCDLYPCCPFDLHLGK